MGLFNHQEYKDYQDSFEQENPKKHKASLTHELIAGAASFEAAKAYENHVAENSGQRPSHEKAKELLAGFAGAFIDKEFETRGLDTFDREKAKYQAREHADNYVANQNY